MAMTRKSKYKYFILPVIMGLVCSLLCRAKADNTAASKIIILIDISGSTSREQPAIRQSLELLYIWLNKEQRQSVDFWVFGDEAEKTTYEEYVERKKKLDQSTHIAKALEKVDEEVAKAIEKNESIFVIVVSDLVASEADSKNYTLDEIKQEQEKIDEILGKWRRFRKDRQMDMLFITWNMDEYKDLSEIEKSFENADVLEQIIEQDGVRCDVRSALRNSSLICDMTKKGDSVSEIEMAGCMIKKVAEMLESTKMRERKNPIERKNALNISSFYKAYFITGRDNDLYVLEGKSKKFLSAYKIETEYMALYCIPTKFSNMEIYETYEKGNSQECCLFFYEISE